MGSDISIVNSTMLDSKKEKIFGENLLLKYPTGEKVPIECKVVVEVSVGKYFVRVPMFVAEISDDCILGADFLKINLQNIFAPIFTDSFYDSERETRCCSRVERPLLKIPAGLTQLYDNVSRNLNETQKAIVAEFLCQNKNVFSESIVEGNCNVVNHVINVKDSSPIKQVPHRIPIHLREEQIKLLTK